MKNKIAILSAALVFSAVSFAAEPQIITIQTKITGSQEQPRVISIVPWQSIEEPNYIGEDLVFEPIDDVYLPIHRNEFRKEIRYISATRKVGQ